MSTAWVLVRNLNSDAELLQFNNFSITKIQHGDTELLNAARKALQTKDVWFDDWVLRRDTPPPHDGVLGESTGRLPMDIEDTLFLLRLFRAGDLSFARFTIQHSDGTHGVQQPYFAICDLMSDSNFPYVFHAADVAVWEAFAADLLISPAWQSDWFGISRRFFLYGGAREYNPRWNEVERVVNYATALEAAILPENTFSTARFSNRGAALLMLDEGRDEVRAVLRDLYELRSSIVHGSVISDEQRERFYQRWVDVEIIVRRVLVSALRRLPADRRVKQSELKAIFDITDTERLRLLMQGFRELGSVESKFAAVQGFTAELEQRRKPTTKSRFARVRRALRKWLWTWGPSRTFMQRKHSRARRL